MPSEQEIALNAAIKKATIWTEDRKSTDGIIIDVSTIQTLLQAARYAREVVDFDNPPELPDDSKGHKRRKNGPKGGTR